MNDDVVQTDRRDFLKLGAAAAVTSALMTTGAYAAGSDEIKVGIIGCGGRGTGAGTNVLRAAKGVKIWALGDAFEDRVKGAQRNLENESKDKDIAGLGNSVEVNGRVFTGLDALQEGHRLRRELHHPRHPAGLPPAAHRGDDQRRQEPLHREARRRRCPRHPQGAGRLRGRQEEQHRRRGRHPAPPPGRLPRSHEADPRRRDRHLRRRALSLGPGHPLEDAAPEGLGGPRGPDAQLVQLHLAVRRPHRRAARPQPRRDELGRPGAPRRGPRHGLPHPHRAGLRAHLRLLLLRLRVPRPRPRRQHLPPDLQLRRQRLRRRSRQQGPRRAQPLHDHTASRCSRAATPRTPTSWSTRT